MSLIDRIYEEMDDGQDERDYQSELLTQLYRETDSEGRELIDRAFICICGYELGSLIAQEA